MNGLPTEIGDILAAITALGLATFALVDAFKLLPYGGVSHLGFARIRVLLDKLLPASAEPDDTMGVSAQLHALWVGGKPLAEQKAVAKSLLKLKLDAQSAPGFAALTGVDGKVLGVVAGKMESGEAMGEAELNVMGRFDLSLTALVDAAYLRADQRYRNGTRTLASVVAVLLAIAGGVALSGPQIFDNGRDLLKLVLAGLLATPLAPISKDLTSALAAGVKLAQTVKR